MIKPSLAHVGMPLLAASTFVLPFVTPSAAALVTIGDHANLLFNGSASVRANDNVFLTENNEESDIIFVFAPGIELSIGANADANVTIYYREDFYLYNDNSQLDSNQSNIFLSSYWNQPRLDLRLNASFEQLVQASPDARAIPGQLVDRDYATVTARGEYDIGERTSASLGLEWTDTQYESPLFVDRETLSVPVNFYYELTPLVDLSIGYRFRNTNTGNRRPVLALDPLLVFGPEQTVPSYTDHLFNVGARGELAPKLVGETRIGYQERIVDGGVNADSLSFALDFSYFATPRTTLTTGLFRDFETGGLGAAIVNTGGSVGVRHTLSHLVSLQAGATYFERYWDRGQADGQQDREEDTLDFSLGITYSPNLYVDLSAVYVFRTNSSNLSGFDYDNNIFSFTAALRY